MNLLKINPPIITLFYLGFLVFPRLSFSQTPTAIPAPNFSIIQELEDNWQTFSNGNITNFSNGLHKTEYFFGITTYNETLSDSYFNRLEIRISMDWVTFSDSTDSITLFKSVNVEIPSQMVSNTHARELIAACIAAFGGSFKCYKYPFINDPNNEIPILQWESANMQRTLELFGLNTWAMNLSWEEEKICDRPLDPEEKQNCVEITLSEFNSTFPHFDICHIPGVVCPGVPTYSPTPLPPTPSPTQAPPPTETPTPPPTATPAPTLTPTP